MNQQLELPFPQQDTVSTFVVELHRDNGLLHQSCPLSDGDAADYRQRLVSLYDNVTWEPSPRSSGWVGLATDGERGHVYRCTISRESPPYAPQERP